MLQEFKQERGCKQVTLDTAGACKRRSFLGGVAFTCTTVRGCSSTIGRRRGSEGAELLQLGLHLTFHGSGSGRTMFISYRLQQLVETSIGVTKVHMTEDTRQRS